MVSIDCIERGVAAYIDKELLPHLDTGGVKGFGLGVAASLMIKRGGNLLREYAKAPILHQLGIVSQDGAVDLDALKDAALERIPAAGLPIELPWGICLRIKADDITSLYEAISKEARI